MHIGIQACLNSCRRKNRQKNIKANRHNPWGQGTQNTQTKKWKQRKQSETVRRRKEPLAEAQGVSCYPRMLCSNLLWHFCFCLCLRCVLSGLATPYTLYLNRLGASMWMCFYSSEEQINRKILWHSVTVCVWLRPPVGMHLITDLPTLKVAKKEAFTINTDPNERKSGGLPLGSWREPIHNMNLQTLTRHHMCECRSYIHTHAHLQVYCDFYINDTVV